MQEAFSIRKKKLKEIITTIIFCGLIISELRFGLDVFFSNILEKIAYIFIYFMSLFFFQIYVTDKLDILENNKRLDLKNYSELRERDAEWLGLILNGEKYEYLAITYNMSIGSVKNRIKVIFDVLGVGDKQGFLNKYSDFQICYGDDFSSIKKKKKKKNLFFNI